LVLVARFDEAREYAESGPPDRQIVGDSIAADSRRGRIERKPL
jgi:hypothetical protein